MKWSLMRPMILAIFLVAQCIFGAEVPPATLSSLIQSFESVSFHKHPSDSGIVAAYCERERQWWGRLTVYHHTEDRIDWSYSFPEHYDEWRGHYVVRCRWLNLVQFQTPILELIESTHMGNGSIFLFEIHDRELRLLLHTKVRGQWFGPLDVFGVPNGGEARIEGDHLNIDYRRIDGQVFDMVFLSGRLEIQDIEGHPKPAKSFEQRCIWDEAKRVFVPSDPTSP